MIRVVALFLLCALPASAQDFRGLLPGMPTSALERIGEPLDRQTDDGFISAIYPLPFERTLGVMHADGEIIALTLAALPPTLLHPPPSDGFQVGVTRLSEALALAGSEGYAFETAGTWQGLPPGGGFLSYTLADHPEVILTLAFFGHLDADHDANDVTSLADMPPHAILMSATLFDQTSVTHYPMLADMQQTPPPPEATPFALPLAEAFPLTILPQ
ncbi:hypothetical protein KUL25_02830 [Rhodobacteraceae bacterium N5(2021)]|uniref:Uncharacterized protein n=1 Tax=Gymnodinialimonas phycosphaerae TaxID=2841589 RepID=A0A975YGH3_9RHOB|nr:hypothetical protein [Gymnodinialimonas phycosphaerae]MBY4891696.1 hypothetical protein [Gymnodinialimonas phycosphaerae]